MATPKGLRNRTYNLAGGGQIMIYSNSEHILVQLRREVPTETDILQASFKVALSLTPEESLNLATELLQIAAPRLSGENKQPTAENNGKGNA